MTVTFFTRSARKIVPHFLNVGSCLIHTVTIVSLFYGYIHCVRKRDHYVYTALPQGGLSYGKGVCLSVRLSVTREL